MQRLFGGPAALVCLLTLGTAGAAFAQPAEMCGDGTTFTVNLPGTTLGIDDSDGFFRAVDVPDVAPPDSLTLPNGCSLYVLLVSGYHQNEHFDRMTFYKVAEFVAENNGYVHVAWWNNLLKEYMGRPLHPVTVTIDRFFFDTVIPPNPGGYSSTQKALTGLGYPENFRDLPKANPASDQQFQQDAAAMIAAIKATNPDALVIVAGHSMGADAVARLGRNRSLPIDLLAVIDPGNNQDSPRGFKANPLDVTHRTFNWTRWRATHLFRGFRQWDCVRNNVGLCRDFDSRFFHVRFECGPVGPFLETQPLLPSRAPIACPALVPYIDPGTTHSFGANIKHLYHRWQHEFIFPFDFLQTERFGFPAPPSGTILGPNYQEPIARNVLFEGDPLKTCANALATDPRRPGFLCGPYDGHGEIVGFRAAQDKLLNPAADLDGPGLLLESWPGDAAGRRASMVSLGVAGPSWVHRPVDPDTCIVCDDINTIIQHLLDQQPDPAPPSDTTAPFSIASADPGPNVNGWNTGDVVLTLTATDAGGGTGVKEIEYSLTGQQTGGAVVTGGDTVPLTITAEGTTTVTYFARDNAGNAEAARALDVRIDRTPPHVEALTSVPHNPLGWFRADVLVSFPASDETGGSGLASVPADVTVSAEGADQAITAVVADHAGNQATASVQVSLDKTAPVISLVSRTPANAAGWNNAEVAVTWSCADTLSGPVSPAVSQVVNTEGAAQAMVGTCLDAAGNAAADSQGNINIDKTGPSIAISTPLNGGAYLLNSGVTADYACADGLSGVGSCDGPVGSGEAVDTSAAGARAFTVTSADLAGNRSSSTHAYAVHYAFSGFFGPIGAMPAVNVVRAGRTVPVKYNLGDALGALITDVGSFASLTSGAVACDATAPDVQVDTTDAAGSTSIRYDADANQFVYNWKTESGWTGSCRMLQLTLSDGTTHLALFEFR